MKQKIRIHGALVKDSTPRNYLIPKDAIISETILDLPLSLETKPHTSATVKWDDVPAWEEQK